MTSLPNNKNISQRAYVRGSLWDVQERLTTLWSPPFLLAFYLQGEYFRYSPPIISIFGYVIEDRKIRNTCFFYFSPYSYLGGWKLRSKLGLKNHFCGENGLFENLVSQSYFAFKDTKFVHWHYSPISNSSRDIPQKWFFNPKFERSFHPPNMKTGKNKKTRISYFSVLYNISKNRNDRRRTPKILSLLVYCETQYIV